MRSGVPLVSSPPTGNQPRHARPASGIAIFAFSSGVEREERSGLRVEPVQQRGIDPWPMIVKKPSLATGRVDRARDRGPITAARRPGARRR